MAFRWTRGGALVSCILIVTGCSSPVKTAIGVSAPTSTTIPVSSTIREPATSASVTTSDREQLEIRRAIAEVEAFVERERGLEFKAEVPVAFLDDEEFERELAGSGTPGGDEEAQFTAFWRALGLLDSTTDLEALMSKLRSDGVVGFYDPAARRLVVRGGRPTPHARSTLAHELTHALDDQWFDLDRPVTDESNEDQQFAFRALVEGSAEHIESLFLESLSDDDRARARFEDAELSTGDFMNDLPEIVLFTIAAPYVFGESLVDAIVKQGGVELLNEAFEHPPTTSAQVIDPITYLKGETATTVSPPTAPVEPSSSGVLGRLSLFLALRDAIRPQTAWQAADGWDGDRYVLWQGDTGPCVRASVATRSEGDANELAAAIREWATARVGVGLDATEGHLVTFTSCG